MRTVWKYELDIGKTILSMPVGAEVLCVQLQNDTPCLWACVDSEQPQNQRTFSIYGTGHELPEQKEKYIGKELPRDIEKLKRQFITEIYKDRWFDRFDKIKYADSKEETSIRLSKLRIC